MPEPTLKELIPEKLRKNLTGAESRLIDAARNGEPLELRAKKPEIDDPANADAWGTERTIRTEFLRWICTDKKASELIDARGIRVYGAMIAGKLDFEGTTIPHLLTLGFCSIKDGITLSDAKTRIISLQGTHTGPVFGDRLTVDGALFLRSGFSAKGKVRLLGAKVGGDFSCSGGSFNNENGEALCAAGIETNGDVFLDDGFSAKGIVHLIGAKVGGNLQCSGGSFNNENGAALIAQKITVEGVFSWQLKKRPIGAIDLMHAKVGVLIDNKESWPKPGMLQIDGFEYDALAPDDTPKKAKERLRWIELQIPPAKEPIPEILTEPLQNKYPIKWIGIRPKRWLNKVRQNIFESKPYGNFNDRPPFEFRPQPYEQLAKVLKNMGHESDSREVLIAKQEALCKCGNISNSRRFWHWFLGITMGHGYRPIRPIVFGLFMVFLGFAIFHIAYENSYMAQSKLSIFKGNMHLYSEFNPYIYSLDTFLPFLDLHQENYWIPAYNHQHPLWSFLIHLYLWFHIIIGWFVTTLAAVSLSGVVRKKE